MKKILPILLALVGLAGGVGAGIVLRPAPAPDPVELAECIDVPSMEDHALPVSAEIEDDGTFEYVKLNNQFVIPDLDNGKVVAMVVLSLNLEARVGSRETIYAREPKLRDAFLQVLFDHANLGGFKGAFTESTNMNALRIALVEVAHKTIGKDINDVLVVDIVRQDVK